MPLEQFLVACLGISSAELLHSYWQAALELGHLVDAPAVNA